MVEEGGAVTNEMTLDYRSYFKVISYGERTLASGTHTGWSISGTHHYDESQVDAEAFCAPDMAIGYREIIPRGSVGRPLTQELSSVAGI